MTSRYENLELEANGSYDSRDVELTFGSNSRRKVYIVAAVVVVAALVALTVGLAVGLRHNSDSSQLGAQRGDVTTSTQSTTPGSERYRPVLMVSLDGFRASYLSYNVTPHIQQLILDGVHTPRLLPAYPSLTFPNHYTIATGLYPESHGIVDNKMYDVRFRRQYRLGSPEASKAKWYGGEPIWLTAQRQGKRTACYFWVGSDVPISGQYPTIYKQYNGSVPFRERVDTVLEWLSLPADQRPDLVTLYFEEPDHTGHAEGPGPGQEMLSALRRVDDVVGQLVTGLHHRGLYDDVNLILLADHGMSARSCSRQVKLRDYLSAEELRGVYVYNGAAGRISNRYTYSRRTFTLQHTPKVSTEQLLRRLSGQPHLAAYDKRHLPKRLHYANNIRIDDIIITMDDEWVVSRNHKGAQDGRLDFHTAPGL